jgi:uncharacterized membrane protein SpoIIM required for sporulation
VSRILEKQPSSQAQPPNSIQLQSSIESQGASQIQSQPQSQLQSSPQPQAGQKIVVIRSAQFRKVRQWSWEKLDQLVTKAEKKGVGSLEVDEAIELPKLYQAEISSLAVARNTVLDKNLVDYLENLSLRAYLVVYGPRTSLAECLKNFFLKSFPGSVRSLKWCLVISASLFLVGLLTGFIMVTQNHDNYQLLVSDDLAAGRNYSTSRPELLNEIIFHPWSGFQESFIFFANTLFRHNTIITLLSFGLGFAFGIPTVILIFTNGLLLGAMIGLHYDKDLTIEFVGWLSIHGVTEITAFILSGGAGLAIAKNVLFPGQSSRINNLAKEGLKASQVMIGAVFMLFIASILEGGFRQLIASTPWRLVIAFLTALFWARYFYRQGREGNSGRS